MGHKEAPMLPDDVLHSIVGRLSSLVCFAAFRSVCKPWRSFFLQHYSFLVPPPLPWIILPDPNSTDSLRPAVYGLYGLHEQKQFYQCKIPVNCTTFIGSSGTWLAYIDDISGKLRLWNPLSLLEMSLPIVRNRKNNMRVALERVFASCAGPLINANEDVVFGVLYNSTQFACMALGDEDWTNIEVDLFPSKSTVRIHDLIFYKGKFYFVDQSGTVFVCEENVRAPRDHDRLYRYPKKAMKFIDQTQTHMSFWQKELFDYEIPSGARDYNYFLVEIEEELILVIKFTNYQVDFRIFKLDFNRRKWVLMDEGDMKSCSLFLGSSCRSVAAKTVSGKSCIYFKTLKQIYNGTQDHKMVVFDYLMRSEEVVLSEVATLHRHYTHPVWIIPRNTNDLKPRSSSFFNFLFYFSIIVGFLSILLGYKFHF